MMEKCGECRGYMDDFLCRECFINKLEKKFNSLTPGDKLKYLDKDLQKHFNDLHVALKKMIEDFDID